MMKAGFLVLALVSVVGCSSAGTATAPAVAGTSQQAIETAEPGPLRMVGQALGEVSLSTEQRARIEAMFRKTETRHQQAWHDSANARKDLLLALADQVQAGTIDRNALAPKIEASRVLLAKSQEEDRKQLVELHQALTPDQRAAFADAFQPQKMFKMFGHKPGPEGENAFKHDPNAPEQEHADHHKGHFGDAFKELNLTSEQRDKIKEAMKAKMGDKNPREMFKAHHEETKKALEAFKTDKFDGTGVFGRKPDRIEFMLNLAEAANSILTPEQRTKAAQILRDRAAHADQMPGGR